MKEVDSTPRFAALQHYDFRLLWIGQVISVTGTQMQNTAVHWHIYELLKNSSFTLVVLGHNIVLDGKALGLGTIGLARIIPVLFFALLGGMIADTQDRRKVMLWAQSGAALSAGLLAVLTLSGYTHPLAIYVLTAAIAAAMAFDSPARQSLVPNLVPREHLTNAISLNTLLWQIAAVVGPALAGLVLSVSNAGVVYAINALSFLAVFAALLLMRYRGHAAAENTGLGWKPLIEGLRFTYMLTDRGPTAHP